MHTLRNAPVYLINASLKKEVFIDRNGETQKLRFSKIKKKDDLKMT